MTKKIYEVTIAGVEYGLQALTPTDLVNVFKAAGKGSDSLTTTNEALKMSIVEIDGRKVSYNDLIDLKRVVKRARVRASLRRAWAMVHDASEDAIEDAKSSVEIREESDVEFWDVTVGERTVTLKECDDGTVAKALRVATKGAKNQNAQGYIALLTNLGKSICAIDGEAVTLNMGGVSKHFTVPETHVLGAVWQELHMGADEDIKLGEREAVSGSA